MHQCKIFFFFFFLVNCKLFQHPFYCSSVETITGLSKLRTHSISSLFVISAEAILNIGISISSLRKNALFISKGVEKNIRPNSVAYFFNSKY